MKEDIPASVDGTTLRSPGGWTLFRNVKEQDAANASGEKETEVDKAMH